LTDNTAAIAARIREARKRRGLTQEQLARASGVSLSLITKLESDLYGGMRLETLHKLAKALQVTTSSLMSGPDADQPEPSSIQEWAPLRHALDGTLTPDSEDEPTIGGVRDAFNDAVDAVLASQYTELSALLPALLRDADALVGATVNGAQKRALQARSQIRQLTAYMMGQTWQFDAASHAIDLAEHDATDDLTAMAAADWKCWVLLREGRLAECAELAVRWADDTEPRLSRATTDELAGWGRFLILISTAAVRDNRPEDAGDALRLARAAATAIGTDAVVPFNPWQVFGPMTVSMVHAENAAVQDRPEATLGIGAQMAGRGFPVPRNYHRHRLDVAHAHTAMREHAEAVGILREIRTAAPEWLAQQRYARDILAAIITRRRTLTDEMRDMASFMHLPL
jgi:transcriptional regulator with XRE-family HTH domain